MANQRSAFDAFRNAFPTRDLDEECHDDAHCCNDLVCSNYKCAVKSTGASSMTRKDAMCMLGLLNTNIKKTDGFASVTMRTPLLRAFVRPMSWGNASDFRMPAAQPADVLCTQGASQGESTAIQFCSEKVRSCPEYAFKSRVWDADDGIYVNHHVEKNVEKHKPAQCHRFAASHDTHNTSSDTFAAACVRYSKSNQQRAKAMSDVVQSIQQASAALRSDKTVPESTKATEDELSVFRFCSQFCQPEPHRNNITTPSTGKDSMAGGWEHGTDGKEKASWHLCNATDINSPGSFCTTFMKRFCERNKEMGGCQCVSFGGLTVQRSVTQMGANSSQYAKCNKGTGCRPEDFQDFAQRIAVCPGSCVTAIDNRFNSIGDGDATVTMGNVQQTCSFGETNRFCAPDPAAAFLAGYDTSSISINTTAMSTFLNALHAEGAVASALSSHPTASEHAGGSTLFMMNPTFKKGNGQPMFRSWAGRKISNMKKACVFEKGDGHVPAVDVVAGIGTDEDQPSVTGSQKLFSIVRCGSVCSDPSTAMYVNTIKYMDWDGERRSITYNGKPASSFDMKDGDGLFLESTNQMNYRHSDDARCYTATFIPAVSGIPQFEYAERQNEETLPATGTKALTRQLNYQNWEQTEITANAASCQSAKTDSTSCPIEGQLCTSSVAGTSKDRRCCSGEWQDDDGPGCAENSRCYDKKNKQPCASYNPGSKSGKYSKRDCQSACRLDGTCSGIQWAPDPYQNGPNCDLIKKTAACDFAASGGAVSGSGWEMQTLSCFNWKHSRLQLQAGAIGENSECSDTLDDTTHLAQYYGAGTCMTARDDGDMVMEDRWFTTEITAQDANLFEAACRKKTMEYDASCNWGGCTRYSVVAASNKTHCIIQPGPGVCAGEDARTEQQSSALWSTNINSVGCSVLNGLYVASSDVLPLNNAMPTSHSHRTTIRKTRRMVVCAQICLHQYLLYKKETHERDHISRCTGFNYDAAADTCKYFGTQSSPIAAPTICEIAKTAPKEVHLQAGSSDYEEGGDVSDDGSDDGSEGDGGIFSMFKNIEFHHEAASAALSFAVVIIIIMLVFSAIRPKNKAN